MSIDWSDVTAIATAASALVIAVTVLVGVRQVRLTSIQLEQLQKATQLQGAMKIFDDLHSPTYVKARRNVATELNAKLNDPTFREEVELGLIWTKNPDIIHDELFVLRTFEAIGSYVRYGLVDKETILDSVAISSIVAWEHLSAVIEIQRRTIQPRMWESFEYLHRLAIQWLSSEVVQGGWPLGQAEFEAMNCRARAAG
jgi:hypothetical protein